MTNDEYRAQCADERELQELGQRATWEVQVPVGLLTDAKARIAALEADLRSEKNARHYWEKRVDEVKAECAQLAEADLTRERERIAELEADVALNREAEKAQPYREAVRLIMDDRNDWREIAKEHEARIATLELERTRERERAEKAEAMLAEASAHSESRMQLAIQAAREMGALIRQLAASEEARKELEKERDFFDDERCKVVEELDETLERLAELERLAREVVDEFKASGFGGIRMLNAADRLAAFLQPETTTPEDIDAAMTCGNDLTDSVHETPGKLLATRKIEVAGTKEPACQWSHTPSFLDADDKFEVCTRPAVYRGCDGLQCEQHKCRCARRIEVKEGT